MNNSLPGHARSTTAPVMVVGAGPTGLAAAMDLAAFGVPCRIIDRLPEPAAHSRAIAVQARTLELFEQRQCIEAFMKLGHKSHAANFYSAGERLLRLDFDPLSSRYPYVLFLDQTQTERIMTGRLEQRGVRIERGVELIGFDDSSAGVELILRHHDGREERTHAPFLIGCDGARSFVRERLKLGFAGATYPQIFLVADLHFDWDLTDEEFHLFASEDGLTAVFPLGNGLHRLVADLFNKPSGREPTLDECREIAARRLHHAARLSGLVWSSYFHVNSRRVEKLRAGHVFVAGDASHIHSPAAGQGMNTGIQEAFNLSWKLALVMRGEADERLLDTYDEERRRIEKQVLSTTDFVFNIIGAQHGVRRFFRDYIAPRLAHGEIVQSYLRRFVSEIGLHYLSGPLTLDQVLDGGLHAGERAADARVNVPSQPPGRKGGRSRLFELLDPAEFTLMLLDTFPSSDPSRIDMASRMMGSLLPERLNVLRVTDPPIEETEAPHQDRTNRGVRRGAGVEEQTLADVYGKSRPSFYLIRPDGYIMLRGTLDHVGEAAQFCLRWFRRRYAEEESQKAA